MRMPTAAPALSPDALLVKRVRESCIEWPGGLYRFAKGVLNQNKLTDHLHLPFANMVQLHDWNGGPKYSSRPVIWLPRGHFKSTIISQALPLWLLSCVDRNMTIALVSAKQDNPRKWLHFIKEVITHNDLFRMCWPEIRPGNKWDQDEIRITRDMGPDSNVQASITALSIGSGLASQHFDYIIIDDLVNEQIAESTVEMDKAVRLFHALEDIARGWFDTKGFMVVGTPWGREDIIHEALLEEQRGYRLKWGLGALGHLEISEGWGEFAKHITPQITPGEPILPSECGWDKLNHIKERNLEQYYLQYLCQPWDEDRNGFHLEKFRPFGHMPDGELVCKCHPNHIHHIKMGTTVVVSDPAYTKDKAGCESAILVGTALPCGCRFLLEEYGGELEPQEYQAKAVEVANRWKSWLAAYCVEDEALQLTVRQWLEEKQGYGAFPIGVEIYGLKIKNRGKDIRIANAKPAVNAGRWHRKPDMARREGNLLHQLYQWPHSRRRDRADAFAYFEDAWDRFPVDLQLGRWNDPDDEAPEEDWNDDSAYRERIALELYGAA